MVSIRVSLRIMRILWGALLGSVGIYVVVMVAGVVQKPSTPPAPVMLPAFAVMSFMIAVVSFVMPAMMYKQAVAGIKVDTVEEPMPDAFTADYRKASPKVKVFADPAAALRSAVAVAQTRLILSLAFSESIAMFGLVVLVMGFDDLMAVPFFVVSAVLMVLRFPTERQILEPFEAAKGASFPRDGQSPQS